jgi:hypothetical protein
MPFAPCVAMMALLCLLTLAPSASAEATWWVVWSSNNGSIWEPESAFADAAACMKEARARWTNAAVRTQPGVRALEYGPATLTLLRKNGAEGGGLVIQWRCLPDVIDPRGPKTK